MNLQAGNLCKWTSDSQRLLLENFDTIHDSPSHIYHSALPLCPSSSWLHNYYGAAISQEVQVVKGLLDRWGTCSRTVSLTNTMLGLSLSCWKDTIAVGSVDGKIIILDAITGIQKAIFSGHTSLIPSLIFSSDGKSLVSGSDDRTIKLWDVQTGGVVRTFFGHTTRVTSVSISPSLTTIVSASNDTTIRIWNIQTGECCCVIMQPGSVDHVYFSPIDPQHFLSICGGRVWQWDINGHLVGPLYDCFHIAFSLDGTWVVLCCGTTATVQESNSGVIVAKFNITNIIQQCCFSPNGRLIAVAAETTVYIWDITSPDPCLIETLTGHTKDITSLVFSSPSSLTSASLDQSVKFWKIGTSSTDPLDIDLNSTSTTSATIKSITLHEKGSIAITSDTDGMVRIWDTLTGLCKASFQTPAKGNDRMDTQVINGRLTAVWYTSTDKKIIIWDVEKEKPLLSVDRSLAGIDNLKISGDGSRVFSQNMYLIYAQSMQTGEIMGSVETRHLKWITSLAVEGSRVWVYYSSGYEGWDFGTPGSLPVQLFNMPPSRSHPNGVVLWNTVLSRIENKLTGKVVFQLSKRYGKPGDVQWNGQYLVIWFTPKEVLNLDCSHVLL